MMNNMLSLVISLMAGVLIGMLFFYGLWWTVQKIVTSERPALWTVGSMGLRMIATLAGFHFVSQGSWERLLACFLGFFLARMIVTHLTRQTDKRVYAEQEISHEPQPR